MKKLLLILLCLPLFYSCGKNNNTKENTIKEPGDNKKVENIPNNICGVEADFFLTTEELEAEFNKDIKKAKKKYNNKIIELTACYYNSGSSDYRPHIQILTSSFETSFFMEFSEKETVNLTKNGMEVKITGRSAVAEYFESLPKCREYSIITMETGEGVGDITIKGVMQYDDLMEEIHFINCCINLM